MTADTKANAMTLAKLRRRYRAIARANLREAKRLRWLARRIGSNGYHTSSSINTQAMDGRTPHNIHPNITNTQA